MDHNIIIVVVALLIAGLGSCQKGNDFASTAGSSITLVPWLSVDINAGYQSNKYGYFDPATQKMMIHPQYADAQPFQNGFAVVAKYTDKKGKARYGVINEQNETVIPFKYDYIEIVTQGGATLVFTKDQYNAWWRFWEWNKPSLFSYHLFTRVLRDRWKVLTLPQKETLLKANKDYTDAYGFGYHHLNKGGESYPRNVVPFNLDVTSFQGLIRIDRRVYSQVNGSLHLITQNFSHFTADGNILIKEHDHYEIINRKGEQLTQKTFTKVDAISVETPEGSRFSFKPTYRNADLYQSYLKDSVSSTQWTEEALFTKDLTYRNPSIDFEGFFKDKEGYYYLAPNFKTPFPTNIQNYNGKKQSYRAKAILKNCGIITVLPGNTYLVGTNNHFKEPYKTFILKGNGRWETAMPDVKAPLKLFPNGWIFFIGTDSKGVLDKNHRFHPMAMKFVTPYSSNPNWYFGLDLTTKKYGVYDVKNQRWQIPPTHDYLAEELVPGVGVYRRDTVITRNSTDFTNRLYGLIDIEQNERITPPIYNFVDSDGRVGLTKKVINNYDVEYPVELLFYVNPYTGKAYMNMESGE